MISEEAIHRLDYDEDVFTCIHVNPNDMAISMPNTAPMKNVIAPPNRNPNMAPIIRLDFFVGIEPPISIPDIDIQKIALSYHCNASNNKPTKNPLSPAIKT